MSYFLGFEIARSRKSILLSQCKYVLDLLIKIGMLDTTLVSTPMNFSSNVSSKGDLVDDHATFRRLIGRFIYLTNMYLDITYVVHHLS